MVRAYNGKKYMSMPKENYEVASVEDIGNVESEVDGCYLQSVLVTGVKLDVYNSCCNCTSKVHPTADDNIGQCGKCSITQRLDKCKE